MDIIQNLIPYHGTPHILLVATIKPDGTLTQSITLPRERNFLNSILSMCERAKWETEYFDFHFWLE